MWVTLMNKTRALLPVIIALAIAPIMVSEASGAAFRLEEKSVKASGRAFAGAAAATDDTGIIAYNPAGMTELGTAQVGVGGYLIRPQVPLENAGSSMTVGGLGPFPVAGDQTSQGFSTQPTGYAYMAAPVMSDLWVSLAVTVPYGLKASYDTTAFSRYDSLKSELAVLDISPAVAFRVNDMISIGGGLDIQHVTATLTNALPNPLDPMGPSPASDGLLNLNAKNWGLGFNLGVHLRPTDRLDIGLTYRYGVHHDLSGTAITQFGGGETSMGAQARLNLPEIYSLGISYRATDTVTLLATIDYAGWDSFKELRVHFADDTEAVTTENFRNSWSASLGADIQVSERLAVRAGGQYDETPTVDAYRSTRIPDPDRIWGTVGLTYNLSNHLAVDMSYAHEFKSHVPVNRVNEFPALATTVETHATGAPRSDVLGLGLRAAF